ncbi:SGNH/GDSL hydrolase family protein [Liquorilactobacillus sicerae]|uniref:SGNH/GDSL hydrolase family protein n=1 Tax=Liquorilactobacillus sicerae TaxID=1416943 RepID=UPI00248037F6|nr:SGNH/GDSL hydrolase family protein [Liquorilactobacillus sicerae]
MTQGEFFQSYLSKIANSTAFQQGNTAEFSLERVIYQPNSKLNGKKIGFLGSSITYGAFSKGVSFVDYLQAIDGISAVKSAISGATLAGKSQSGYLTRLKTELTPQGPYDLLVCQLSTNDLRQGKQFGQISTSFQPSDYDLETVIGSIEYICQYTRSKLHCPLVFYTCIFAGDDSYDKLVKQLFKLQQKWHFQIIDLYHDSGINASTRIRRYAMFDRIHPTQAGYLKIWVPFFEQKLIEIFKNN